jgi:phosphoesterase RecJ-like protein
MSEPQIQNIRRISEAIRQHRRFLVVTHVRPDGDAVGSLLALSFMLRKLGKEVVSYSQDTVPPGLDFLPGVSDIIHHVPDLSRYEVAMFVDCGELHRAGPVIEESIDRVPTLINIDHHISKGTPFGDIFWVEPSASSTCEMLHDLAAALPVDLDPDMASQLYTGVLTDTGSFRFSNTNQRVMEVATRLVAAGAKPDVIAEHVYDSASPQRLRLLAMVLATSAFLSDNRIATAELTRKMFQETGTSPMDGEGFINHFRSVGTVEMAMLFREEKNGMVHVSMRSKGRVDVATLAQRHGGGGHRHAAAFRVSGSLQKLRREFTQEAMRYLG